MRLLSRLFRYNINFFNFYSYNPVKASVCVKESKVSKEWLPVFLRVAVSVCTHKTLTSKTDMQKQKLWPHQNQVKTKKSF